jgi:hypothetical protein
MPTMMKTAEYKRRAEAAEAELARLLAREAELCAALEEIAGGLPDKLWQQRAVYMTAIAKDVLALHSTGERHARVIAAANKLVNDRVGDGPYTLVKSEWFKKLSEACDAALKEPADGLG